MRHLALLLMILWAMPVEGHAAPITVLTSDYHVWGYLDGVFFDPINQHVVYAYDNHSHAPISASVSHAEFAPPNYPQGAISISSSHTGEFFANAMSTAVACSVCMPNIETVVGQAYAEASWTFRPLTDDVSLGVHGVTDAGDIWGGTVFVTDLTLHTALYQASVGFLGGRIDPIHYNGAGGGNIPFDLHPALTFDPDHRYSLTLFSTAQAGSDFQNLALQAQFLGSESASVPELSSMLLLALGLVVLTMLPCRRNLSVPAKPAATISEGCYPT